MSYNWFVVFADVGEVELTVSDTIINSRNVYHAVGFGKSNSWWDKFFPVRDYYETWVYQDNLLPIRFKKTVQEGGFRVKVDYRFAREDSTVYSAYATYDNDPTLDTIAAPPCTYDVISALLNARNFNFNNIEPGDKFPITIILDRDIFNLYFRYIGIEEKKIKHVGTFECMKFAVLVVEGTVFDGGEDLNIWVTNDKNRIPIYAESPIIIGNVRARITKIENTRYPLTSKIEDD